MAAATSIVASCSAGDGGTGAAAIAPENTAATTAVSGTVAIATAPPSTLPTTSAPAPTTTVLAGPPARIEPPTDATGFATAFDAAQRMIVDPASDAAAVEAAGQQLQLLLRSLADRPELDEQVVLALSDDVRTIIEPIIRARQFLQARSAADTTPTPPSPTLPAWTIRAPEPIDVLRGYYDEAEQLTGVPWYWLAAINLQETRMGRIDGVSSAGAVGPMQFLPTTWAECCTGDPTVTRDAIIGAATYLAQSGAPGDMQAAVYQYNPNDSYVAIVTAYAETLRDQPAMYAGYHAFQVFAGSAAGTVRLPIGYSQTAPVDAATYRSEHPDDIAS
jgi:membrane-bound lytic murein transglycosylase B